MSAAFSLRCICGGIRSVSPFQRRLFGSVSTSETHVLTNPQEQDPATTLPKLEPTQQVKNRRLTKDEQDRLAYLYKDGKDPYPRQIQYLFPGLSLRSLIYRIRVVKGTSVRRRKRWTPDEIEKLLNLVASGRKTHELLGVFPDRTESAMENILARWRPGNSLLSEKMAAEDAKEMTEWDRNDSRNSLRDGHLYVSDNGTPSSSAAAAIDHPLPWIPMQEPRLLWTEAEDRVLDNLVQKAMKTRPDRWRRELSRLLSDPKERVGLDPSRTFTKSIQRLNHVQAQHFVSKKQWTPSEHALLMKAVSSETGVTLDRKPTCLHTSNDHNNLSSSTDHSHQAESSGVPLESLKGVNWKRVALEVGTKDDDQCRRRFSLFNGVTTKGPWSPKENELFKHGVAQYGQNWKKIASLVGTRTPGQARSKYLRLAQEKEKDE